MIVDLPEELKSYFNKWKPKRGSGVPQIQNLLEIDRTKDHPFRKGIKGAPRLFFIVPDDQGKLIQLASWQVLGRAAQGLSRDSPELALRSRTIRSSTPVRISEMTTTLTQHLGIMNRFGVSSSKAKPGRTRGSEDSRTVQAVSHRAREREPERRGT
jgi:hypothetical protein